MSDLIDIMEALKSINKSAEDALSGSYQDKERELENISLMSGLTIAMLRQFMWNLLSEDIDKVENECIKYFNETLDVCKFCHGKGRGHCGEC